MHFWGKGGLSSDLARRLPSTAYLPIQKMFKFGFDLALDVRSPRVLQISLEFLTERCSLPLQDDVEDLGFAQPSSSTDALAATDDAVPSAPFKQIPFEELVSPTKRRAKRRA